MRTVAIVMILLVLAAVAVVGYGLFNTTLQVIAKDLQVFSAAERPAEFEQIRTNVERDALIGTRLKSGALKSAEEYQYRVYTLRVKNNGLVAARMTEMQIAPMLQDVLYYGESGEVVIEPGQTRDIWCVLLTEGNTHNVRDIHITYYLWGNPHEVKFTYDDTI